MNRSKEGVEDVEDNVTKKRPIASSDKSERDEQGFTPEMRAVAEALTKAEGDPYSNARDLGFYCEQCG